MKSQTDMILNYLKDGNRITPIDALNKFGCFRLGARIHDLKQSGHLIESNIISNGHKKFAQYYMPYKESKGQLCF